MSFSEIKLGYMEFHYYYMRHETCTNRLGLGWGWVKMCWDGIGFGFGCWVLVDFGFGFKLALALADMPVASPHPRDYFWFSLRSCIFTFSIQHRLNLGFFSFWHMTLHTICNYIIQTSAVLQSGTKTNLILLHHKTFHTPTSLLTSPHTQTDIS